MGLPSEMVVASTFGLTDEILVGIPLPDISTWFIENRIKFKYCNLQKII